MARVRGAAKGVMARLLHGTGLQGAVARLGRALAGGRRVQIVAYHRVVESLETERARSIPGMLISAATFARQLEEAHAAGFAFASLGEALSVLDGTRSVRHDLLVVTFDDGYREVVEHALPVLERMGVPAIMYLATDAVGTNRRLDHDRLWHLLQWLHRQPPGTNGHGALPPPVAELLRTAPQARSETLDAFIARYPAETVRQAIAALQQLLPTEDREPAWGAVMTWDDVGRWMAAGMEVGTHTLDHRVLTHEPPSVLEEHLRRPREALESAVGRTVRDFAYCNGWYSDALVDALKGAGYRSAVTTEARPNTLGVDPFRLRRRVLNEGFSLDSNRQYSAAVTACQMDDTFGTLGFTRPVLGHTTQAAR